MIGRTGSTGFQMRYDDEQDPVVWVAVALYKKGRWECAAGPGPVEATLRLCEHLMDGGRCAHCGRPSGFNPDFDATMPLEPLVCWYQWDPERKTYRRGCE